MSATSIKPRADAARLRRALSGWIGFAAHRLARLIRCLLAASADADPANIAVVCPGFVRYGASQAIGLQQTGCNVTLYYVDGHARLAENPADRALMLGRARAAGVGVVAIPRRNIRGLLKDALWLALLKDTLWLRRDMRRRRIAAAVVQSHVDQRLAVLGLAMPIALILHDPAPHSGATRSVRSQAIARAAELTCACLILHSERLFDQVRPLLRRVPRGVVAHGADMAPAPAPVPSARKLLVFGRLVPYKGVDTALDALGYLPATMSDIELIVAGRGPSAELARGQPNVRLRDEYVSDSDLETLLDEVRLVLLPYKDATQSGVGLHAIERGVPCIVSSVGGLPELVNDISSGLVVAPDDPGGLAAAIAAQIDHDQDLRQRIYDHAKTHFSWPVVAQRLREEMHRLDALIA